MLTAEHVSLDHPVMKSLMEFPYCFRSGFFGIINDSFNKILCKIMEIFVGLGVGTLVAAVFLWLLPIILIARSDKTTGMEKLVWILLILFFTWFAWIVYALVAPLNPKEDNL